MPPISLARLAPLTGVAFVALFIVAILLEGEPPDTDEATEEVVRHWVDKDSRNIAAALLFGLSGVFLVWFGGSVRATLRRAEGEPGRVAAIAFGGFLVAALGAMTFAGFQFAAAETAGDVPPEVTHTLAVLNEWFFIPLAAGMVLAFLATGIAILRHGGLPRWAGYVAIVVAIGFLLPPPAVLIGGIIALLWVLVVSVWLFLNEEPAGSPGVARTPG